jgi:uncharacterized protein
MSSACPICGKPAQDAARPFCSKRCADVDLAERLGRRFTVSAESGWGNDRIEVSPA